MFIYSSCGKWVFPPLLWSFLPRLLLQAFPLLVAGHVLLLLPSPAGLFIHSSMSDFPSPPLWHSGHPVLFATCLFCCYCLLFSFFSLGGGQSVQGVMLIWPRIVCGSTTCSLAHLWSVSSQAVWALPSGSGKGALLVSPFKVKWKCYV
jgi:hypothetical protein